jgi:hypothetical protein
MPFFVLIISKQEQHEHFQENCPSRCAISTGVICNFPHNLEVSDAVSLRGRNLDDVVFFPPINDAVSLSGKNFDDVAFSLPTNDALLLREKNLDDAVFSPPTNETRVASPAIHDDDGSGDIKLDFFVAGFPKFGTTTLLKTFDAHNETSVHPEEECSLAKVFEDDIAYTGLMNKLN